MPYPAEHKRETRERIVECARQLFNRKGFVEVSIDEIMAAAGLTRGGFYSYFKTKEDLFVEAIEAFGHSPPTRRWEDVELDFSLHGVAFARQLINAYLSHAHLQDRDSHCPMIALPSDVGRAGPRVRTAYQQLVEKMAGVFERNLPQQQAGSQSHSGRETALALTALCVGGMLLARTLDDAGFSSEIREAVRVMALELSGCDQTVHAPPAHDEVAESV
jgi:AcrR family transcriptional regulator